jgi:hypothetical protein
MRALDSFISPIPGFDSDVLTLAIPVLTQLPHDESTSDPSAGTSASASRTQAGKWKVTADTTPQKKAKKVMGRSIGGVKINEPTPKSPASTPPPGPQQRIPIHCSKRYARHEYFSLRIIL